MKLQQSKLLLLAIFSIAIVVVSFTPYFNLFLSPIGVFVCIYLSACFILKFSSKVNILLGSIFIILSLPWLLIGSRVRIELFGVLAFLAFFIAIVQEAIEARKSN
jgi:hypothetical protein